MFVPHESLVSGSSHIVQSDNIPHDDQKLTSAPQCLDSALQTSPLSSRHPWQRPVRPTPWTRFSRVNSPNTSVQAPLVPTPPKVPTAELAVHAAITPRNSNRGITGYDTSPLDPALPVGCPAGPVYPMRISTASGTPLTEGLARFVLLVSSRRQPLSSGQLSGSLANRLRRQFA